MPDLIRHPVPDSQTGYPKLTNEVQHLSKVLLWENITIKSTLKSGVKLPDYVPRCGGVILRSTRMAAISRRV